MLIGITKASVFISLEEETRKDEIKSFQVKSIEPNVCSNIEETISSAFQYEIGKLDKQPYENDALSSGIDKTELEGMSSFFSKILSNPFNKEKETSNTIKNLDQLRDKTDCGTSNKSLNDPEIKSEKSLDDFEAVENAILKTEPNKEEEIFANENIVKDTSATIEKLEEITSACKNIEQSSYSPMPSIPSKSKYEAIEALDEGDEQRELEKWAERTETITRLEHER